MSAPTSPRAAGTAPAPRLLLLTGATGTGKTGLALELARAWGRVELVGADSVQVYRGLDVGSAKPTRDELGGVPHHLLDVADLREPFDAARYVALADAALAEVRARGAVPLVVGGTGLYLRALVWGLAEGIPSDAALRAALNERAARPGELARMHGELARVDPSYAARVSPNDPVRVVRALEVHALSGEPLSAHHARHAAQPPRYDARWLALDVPREALRAGLAARAEAMFARGWVDEVRGLLAAGYDRALKPLRAVGYAEVLAHVLDGVPLDETKRRVTYATAAFAKRQGTWLRGERGVTWVPPARLREDRALRDELRAWLEEPRGGTSTVA